MCQPGWRLQLYAPYCYARARMPNAQAKGSRGLWCNTYVYNLLVVAFQPCCLYSVLCVTPPVSWKVLKLLVQYMAPVCKAVTLYTSQCQSAQSCVFCVCTTNTICICISLCICMYYVLTLASGISTTLTVRARTSSAADPTHYTNASRYRGNIHKRTQA